MSKKISLEIEIDSALSEIEIKEVLEYYGWKDVLNEICLLYTSPSPRD